MTSSESIEPERAPVREPAPSQVLAAGHLHPGMLFLRMVDYLRNSIVPALLVILTGQWWLAGVVLFAFVAMMMYALARYLTFQYQLTEDELITTEGILHRQERRIPVNRIQDLNFESTLLRRMFGLVVVSVETASSSGAEAKLDSLSRRNAEVLRETLYWMRARLSGEVQQPQVEETMLFKSSATELALLGMTNNRIGAILLGIVGLYEVAADFGLGDMSGPLGAVFEWLGQFSPPFMAVIVAALLFSLLLGGWLLSVIASFVMFHDFSLTLRDDVVHRRFGLITTRAQSLPRRKIQRVMIGQSLLRRLLRMGIVRADSAGSGMDEKEEARGGRDIIAPMCQVETAEALVPWLLPGLEIAAVEWHRVSPKVVVRIFMKGVLWTGLLLGFGLPMIGPVAWLATAIVPASWLVGFLAYTNLAYARVPGHVAFRWGILGRYRAFVPLRKVQGAVLRAGPVERLLGLATLTVYVAGGSPTAMSNLPRGEAEALEHALATLAARSKFVW